VKPAIAGQVVIERKSRAEIKPGSQQKTDNRPMPRHPGDAALLIGKIVSASRRN
jgi:hypothetical protein